MIQSKSIITVVDVFDEVDAFFPLLRLLRLPLIKFVLYYWTTSNYVFIKRSNMQNYTECT